ncbi:Nicotinamidase-related amidase [Actinacidiphila yanglinensis]|uniref:Nicotinamidase-related amidase n=1 Tax=Actinacidiphila yanglinensis TaxID=310779 RepID=A0A1H6EB56_9ACTN|nr:MFS transporter [Actinacidiphila yanglinensis]SEG94987.1 Nicotinamidase-related amidase [Actinacidiphila yanglinensis]
MGSTSRTGARSDGRIPDGDVRASTDADTPDAESWRRRPFGPRFVAPLLMGATLNPVNSSVIATALVAIAASVGVSVSQTAILISCLYLTSAIAQPTAGRLSEEFGPRRVFLVGIVVVFLGGMLGGVATDLRVLVVARVLIGLGTSAGYPSAMLLIRRRATAIGLNVPPSKVLGSLAIAGAVTVAVGPAIGGMLVGWFGWRAAFLVNVPFTILTFAMALAWIAKDSDVIRGRAPREVLARIDAPGIVGFGATMTSLLVFLLSLPDPQWGALALTVVFAAALVRWSLRATNPFLDVRLLASNGALTRTYLRSGLSLLGVYTMLYGLTQWLEAAHGLSAYAAGLALLPMGLLSAVAARLVTNRVSVRTPLIAAAVLLVLGSTAALFLTSSTPVIAVIGVTAVFGIMSGISNLSNQTALYREAPPEKLGTASGLLRTFGYVGSIASATLTGIAFRSHVSDSGLHHVSLILIAIGAVVLLMTVFDRRLKPASDEIPSPRKESIPMPVSSAAPTIVPSRTALLLMDYQGVVLDAIPDAEPVLDHARQALGWARDNEVQVVYVRVAFTPQDFAQVPAHNKAFAAVADNGFLLDGSPETEVHGSLDVHDDDIVVRKTRFGAFSSTDLHGELHAKGVDTLIVAGISTSGVVLSTLRDAADQDYRLFVLADATSDPDPEVHRILIDKVFPHQADILNTGDLKTLCAA